MLAVAAFPVATLAFRALAQLAVPMGAAGLSLLVIADLAVVAVVRRAGRSALAPLSWIYGRPEEENPVAAIDAITIRLHLPFLNKIPELAGEIRSLKEAQRRNPRPQPSGQRMSDASKDARISQLAEGNRKLREEVGWLKDQMLRFSASCVSRQRQAKSSTGRDRTAADDGSDLSTPGLSRRAPGRRRGACSVVQLVTLRFTLMCRPDGMPGADPDLGSARRGRRGPGMVTGSTTIMTPPRLRPSPPRPRPACQCGRRRRSRRSGGWRGRGGESGCGPHRRPRSGGCRRW